MEITKTEIFSSKLTKSHTAVVVADLHNREYKYVVSAIERINPEYILIPGDLANNLDYEGAQEYSEKGLAFLSDAAKIAKTYYSIGNHEKAVNGECAEIIKQSGVVLLDDETIKDGEIVFGGLTTGMIENRYGPTPEPNIEYLKEFSKEDGFKLLLCHHPEYYPEYIRETEVDLTVSGHAHGGQWRIFGHGVYAPGQGLFPKYTSGLYENRLYVSRGLTNTCCPLPRLFNKTELAVLYMKNE